MGIFAQKTVLGIRQSGEVLTPILYLNGVKICRRATKWSIDIVRIVVFVSIVMFLGEGADLQTKGRKMTLDELLDKKGRTYEFTWERIFLHPVRAGFRGLENYCVIKLTFADDESYVSPRVKETLSGILRWWLAGLLQGRSHERNVDKIVSSRELV